MIITIEEKMQIINSAQHEIEALNKTIEKCSNLRPKNLFNFYGYEFDTVFLEKTVDNFSEEVIARCKEKQDTLLALIDAVLNKPDELIKAREYAIQGIEFLDFSDYTAEELESLLKDRIYYKNYDICITGNKGNLKAIFILKRNRFITIIDLATL